MKKTISKAEKTSASGEKRDTSGLIKRLFLELASLQPKGGPVRANPEAQLCRDITSYLLSAVARYNVLFFHVPNGVGRSVVSTTLAKQMGMIPGAPDYVVIIEGKPILMEVKTDSGTQSREQRRMEAWAAVCGVRYVVVRSVLDVEVLVLNATMGRRDLVDLSEKMSGYEALGMLYCEGRPEEIDTVEVVIRHDGTCEVSSSSGTLEQTRATKISSKVTRRPSGPGKWKKFNKKPTHNPAYSQRRRR